MKRLGISVYPEHAGKKACYDYMALAGKYGFNCLLSVTETKEEIVENFNEFCKVAHENGLIRVMSSL